MAGCTGYFDRSTHIPSDESAQAVLQYSSSMWWAQAVLSRALLPAFSSLHPEVTR